MGREIGTSIGDYRLLQAIGSGAGGEVFRAEHTITRRIEAIKLLTHRMPGEEEQSTLREIEIQASLQHPNIAAVHNAFRIPEGLALVMELVEGEPLSAKLDRGRIPLRDGARYVLQTLDALAYAHEHRVVHRDVKPANIVVTADGSVKLTDFGLARLFDGQPTCPGTVAGSPYYMSPEQVSGVAPTDVRSDCYSAGVILFEVAAGRRPFDGESAFEVMLQQREAAPPEPISLEPRIGAELNAVILKAIEKDPARRFQSAVEFRASLEQALANCPAMREQRARRGNWRWALAAAIATLALSAALVPSVRRKPVPTQPAPAPAVAPPAAPAVVPPAPEPEDAAVPDEPVSEPQPAPHAEPEDRKALRRKLRQSVRQPLPAAAPPKVFVPPQPKPEPQAQAAAMPAALPPSPEIAPVPAPNPPSQLAADSAAPRDAAAPEPAKRPGLLRRTLSRIPRPWSKKPEPAAQPLNRQRDKP